jgi:hypothetical protein
MLYRYILFFCIFSFTISRLQAAQSTLSATHRTVQVSSGVFRVAVIKASLHEYTVKVGIAGGQVGKVADLASIAARQHAHAAINGCFFEAYSQEATKPPNHHVFSGGNLLHLGNVGTTLGFDTHGNYRMERLHLTIRGCLDGNNRYPDNWFAYIVNRPIQTGAAAAVYTPEWSEARTSGSGTCVWIKDGRVADVSLGSVARPQKGYVLVLSGTERHMANRFWVGRTCKGWLDWGGADVNFWRKATEVLGCGPRLVADGRIDLAPEAEGFTSSKILSAAARRSAVGITANREILLVTCERATMRDLAQVMLALGAYDAMNLDGGASSGLWANGQYLTKPGRQISNALLLVKR